MNKKKDSKGARPIEMTADDDMLPEYNIDYSKAKPNRFAGRVKFTRGGARKGAGRKPAPEPLVAKRVYLYPRHLKLLSKIDTNLSAAIRRVVDERS